MIGTIEIESEWTAQRREAESGQQFCLPPFARKTRKKRRMGHPLFMIKSRFQKLRLGHTPVPLQSNLIGEIPMAIKNPKGNNKLTVMGARLGSHVTKLKPDLICETRQDIPAKKPGQKRSPRRKPQ
jgi:hypothetical protein